MTRFPAVDHKTVIKALRKAGFQERTAKSQTGSHRHFEKVGHLGIVTVPCHDGRTLKRRTLKSILGQAGFTLDQFLILIGQKKAPKAAGKGAKGGKGKKASKKKGRRGDPRAPKQRRE